MATTKAKATPASSKHKAAKKKAPVKKQAVVKRPAIELVPENQPFFEFRITPQTLYWLVLGTVSIIFAVWIVTLDARIQKLYDEIDMTTSMIDQPMPVKKAAAPSPTTE